MFSRIFRQYRRFLLGCALLTLGTILATELGFSEPFEVEGPPVLTAISLILAVVILMGLLITVFTLLLPAWLPMVEVVLLALLLSLPLEPVWQLVAAKTGAPDWISCFLLAGLIVAVERFIYGSWQPRSWRRDLKPCTTTFTVPGTPEIVWAKLAPIPAHKESYYWPDASFLPSKENSSADFILSLPRKDIYKDVLVEIRINKSDAPRHLSYRADPLAKGNEVAYAVEFRIDPISHERCRVTYSRQLLSVTPGKRLFLYLTNDFRDMRASLRARLSGRRDRSIQGLQMLRS
ncbi:hypothetical protein [Leisingera sp. ANG-M7]|uniref:hypothetical protein n=1 Tax=Leisingera sp. ANG-M7 TaxID=1577902 RepID=UPI000580A48F|nr:hypothetical protein [Leisingera sp. ANG-M7]KIC35263.1 hypothetical protein RA26_18320 [Leisingera sp. ANG-M7]